MILNSKPRSQICQQEEQNEEERNLVVKVLVVSQRYLKLHIILSSKNTERLQIEVMTTRC